MWGGGLLLVAHRSMKAGLSPPKVVEQSNCLYFFEGHDNWMLGRFGGLSVLRNFCVFIN